MSREAPTGAGTSSGPYSIKTLAHLDRRSTPASLAPSHAPRSAEFEHAPLNVQYLLHDRHSRMRPTIGARPENVEFKPEARMGFLFSA
jgi:hypothetical protein